MSRDWSRRGLLTSAVLLAFGSGFLAQTPPLTPDIPSKFEAPIASYDYVKRDVMIPMRDGVKLHTVILVPKGAKGAPILLTRTPYSASELVHWLADSRKRLCSRISGRRDCRCCSPTGSCRRRPRLRHPTCAQQTLARASLQLR